MLYRETDELPDLRTFDFNEERRELVIRFVFDIPKDKKFDYAADNERRITDWIKNDCTPLVHHLLGNVSRDSKKYLSLLGKHLRSYVAKNTFDYFIHKDLGGFLSRELDFYIKNEVMHLDDVDTTDEKKAETWLAQVRAIRRVGKVIIDFLAQIENFQKKLWLKKKFVVATHYCLSLDRVPVELYPEIAANDAQRQEWVRLFAINELTANQEHQQLYSEPLTVDFLRQNQNLLLDTRFFSEAFKERLLQSLDNLDDQCDGLLIHSENFQALQLLQSTYRERVKCIYIDPPYNTGNDDFIYKDNCQHSSWLSMIYDRLLLGCILALHEGAILSSIDEYEHTNLHMAMDATWGHQNYIADFVWAAGRKNDSRLVSISHEYMTCYAKSRKQLSDAKVEWRQRKKGLNDIYATYEKLKKKYGDDFSCVEKGLKQWYASLPESHPAKAHKHYCRVDHRGIYFPDNISWPGGGGPKYDVFHPITHKPVKVPSRGWIYPSKERMDEMVAQDLVQFGEDETSVPCLKSYLKDREYQAPYSVFYQDGRAATKRLRHILGKDDFGFPKDDEVILDVISCFTSSHDIYLDYFAGSGTTAHAVMNLNREDGGKRKYILVEMGAHFDTVLKPRLEKVAYAKEWKDGKPTSRDTGLSHCFKYLSLESYEDALSNIELPSNERNNQLMMMLGDEYLLNYMLNLDATGSILNLEAFRDPFAYRLKVTERNETKETHADLVETFNYLIGLTVTHLHARRSFNVTAITDGEYEGAVGLVTAADGAYTFRQVEGTLRDGTRVLVIWRTVRDNLLESNAALDAYFTRYRINPADREFDVIYVNGDNTIENLRRDDETWKVWLIEPEFKKRMFEEE